MNSPLDLIIEDETLSIVRDGSIQQVRRPFLPFSLVHSPGMKTWFDLFERRDIPLGKVTFQSLDEKRSYTQRSTHERILDMSYLDEILTFGRKFLTSNSQTAPLKILALDIEVESDGSIFPSSARNPILCIGTEFEGHIRIWGDEHNTLTPDGERAALTQFSEYVQSINPDVILTYNGREFDVPYIYSRCEKYGINPHLRRHDCQDTVLCGRVHLDLLDSVIKDQSLYGIPNRQMKTVAGIFNLENIVTLEAGDIRNTRRMYIEQREKLFEYLRSDVRITRSLGKIYLPNIIALSEMTGIPINQIVEGHNSLIPKITHARELFKRGLIFLSRNIDRYPILEEAKFEAAYVDIFQTGRFEKVWKADFSSMYPSSMVTLNLSPETCRIVEFTTLSENPDFKRVGNILLLRIPDVNFKKDVCIEVDMNTTGFVRKNILELRALRTHIKKQMVVAKTEEEISSLNSQQVAIKVLSNTMFGLAGLKFAQFSDLSIAIATVGTCRWLTKRVINWIETS